MRGLIKQFLCMALISAIALFSAAAFAQDMNVDDPTQSGTESYESGAKAESPQPAAAAEEVDTLPDGETAQEEQEPYVRPADRLYSLHPLKPGEIEYINCRLPESPIAAMAVFDLDDEKSPGLVFVTTESMDAYHFTDDGEAKSIWSAEYSEKYPRRGFAAAAIQGLHKGNPLLFVTINKFKKAFAYKWDKKQFIKAGRVNGGIVDTVRGVPVSLISTYGGGVISFDGGATRFVDNTGGEPLHASYPLHGSYYSACVLNWSSVSPKLATVAAVDQSGIIKVFVEGLVKYHTDIAYGGILKCVGAGKSRGVIYATSESQDEDFVAALAYDDSGLIEMWRSSSLGGSIVSMDVNDMDRDGDMEIIGVLRTAEGRKMLFRVRPDDGVNKTDISADDVEDGNE